LDYVGPDGDTHTFEPTPSDSIALAHADIVVENGVGLEPWLDSLVRSAQSKSDRIIVTKGLALLKGEDDDKHDHQARKKEAGHDQHDRDDFDPHVWHDVKNVMHMVEQIRDGLAKRDPAHAEVYNRNAAAYSKQLEDLDKWVVTQLATIPPANRKLVTNHDTFGYFAHRYGFEVVGTALGSLSTETVDQGGPARQSRLRPTLGDFDSRRPDHRRFACYAEQASLTHLLHLLV
jgi:zinc/manganese transport system substrate-binding protein